MHHPTLEGYRLPAEWETHARTWLSWPHKRASWPGKFGPIPAIWTELVEILVESEPVNVLAAGAQVYQQAQRLVGNLSGVTIHDVPTNDAWIRDYGPTFLVGPGEPALIDWKYNAWGGKYPPFDLDDSVPRHVARITGRRTFSGNMVLEAGAIEVNGRGTLLTTEQCLLNTNRNPAMSQKQIETRLQEYLGVENILWLASGIAGDDTDGHIDELARFVGPRAVVAALEEDSSDENYEPLQENFSRLLRMKDQEGLSLEVIPLPMPRPIYHDNMRLPASYANFYIANGVVVVPRFDDPADTVVVELLAGLFPDRHIHRIRAVDLVWGLGALHCITQQEPVI